MRHLKQMRKLRRNRKRLSNRKKAKKGNGRYRKSGVK